MRWGRVRHGGQIYLARMERDGDVVVPIRAQTDRPGSDPLRELLHDYGPSDIGSADPCSNELGLADVTFEAPLISPQKVMAIGLNYADHARESGVEPPAAPVMFAKLPSSICGPDAPIRYSPEDSGAVDYEVELALIIGRRARNVAVATALEHVLGYTVCNDVSARDAQFADGQWVRGKSFDTFTPLGPWIVTSDEIPDPQRLRITCRVNGVTLQDSSTSEMIFGCAEIVSYLSRVITLEPGDVIATGTPYGVGFARKPPVYLHDGDVVEAEIEGIGVLRNPVAVDSRLATRMH